MKININQKELQDALSVVIKGVSSRSTLPILSGVFFKAKGDTLVLQSTDLELSIQYSVSALVEKEGSTVIPGKLLFEIIKSLPDGSISLELIEDTIVIICGASSFSLKVLDSQDFPGFPSVAAEETIQIPFSLFSMMTKKVARVVSKDESRMILTGVLISVEENNLKMVATDSYRLAITEATLNDSQVSNFEAVISGPFLQDIASLNKTNDLISFSLSENQIVVSYQNTVFINRRLEGNFPNYKQLLPDNFITRAKISTEQLITAVKRISLVNSTVAPIKFDINIESQTVQLSSIAQDVGSAQEVLSCEVTGEDTEIAFNYAYILDGLLAASEDSVFLELQDTMKPGIFKTEDESNFLYLIMPVRIS